MAPTKTGKKSAAKANNAKEDQAAGEIVNGTNGVLNGTSNDTVEIGPANGVEHTKPEVKLAAKKRGGKSPMTKTIAAEEEKDHAVENGKTNGSISATNGDLHPKRKGSKSKITAADAEMPSNGHVEKDPEPEVALTASKKATGKTTKKGTPVDRKPMNGDGESASKSNGKKKSVQEDTTDASIEDEDFPVPETTEAKQTTKASRSKRSNDGKNKKTVAFGDHENSNVDMNGKEPKAAASNGKKVEAEAMDEAPKATKRGKGKKAQEQDVEETAAIEIIYDAPKATKSGKRNLAKEKEESADEEIEEKATKKPKGKTTKGKHDTGTANEESQGPISPAGRKRGTVDKKEVLVATKKPKDAATTSTTDPKIDAEAKSAVGNKKGAKSKTKSEDSKTVEMKAMKSENEEIVEGNTVQEQPTRSSRKHKSSDDKAADGAKAEQSTAGKKPAKKAKTAKKAKQIDEQDEEEVEEKVGDHLGTSLRDGEDEQENGEEVQEESKAGSKRKAEKKFVIRNLTEEEKSVAAKVQKAAEGSKKLLGVHVSASQGIQNAVINAASIGCRSFAFFITSPRTFKCQPLEERGVKAFVDALKMFGLDSANIVVHGSYLTNVCNSDEAKQKQSLDLLIEQAQKCAKIGVKYFVFHPGSAIGMSREEAVKKVADAINTMHEKTPGLVVSENMSGQKSVLGNFEELKEILDHVKDKNRSGVCLDTCHAFVSGYDLKKKEEFARMMNEFDATIGLKYLKAVHINESKSDCRSHLDRHENIGKGKIGNGFFKLMMNDPRFDGIPMILETPEGNYANEMEMLYKMAKE